MTAWEVVGWAFAGMAVVAAFFWAVLTAAASLDRRDEAQFIRERLRQRLRDADDERRQR